MTDKLVDLIGIGNLLESLVTEDVITCEERDQIMAKTARENDIAEHEYKSLHIAGYGMSMREVLERMGRRTEITRAHSEDAPGYVIQRWLRSENTLAFLNLWEKENNPNYRDSGYIELLEKKKTASFTLTPKLWIEQTKAIGIVSKQGKSGGTFAHPMIACEFASWIAPKFKMLLLKLSLNRTKLS